MESGDSIDLANLFIGDSCLHAAFIMMLAMSISTRLASILASPCSLSKCFAKLNDLK